MFVTRIGALKREPGGTGLENYVNDVPEGHVMDMGAFEVAPAQVHPQLFRRQTIQGMVQHLHVQFHDLFELVDCQVAELGVSAGGQVRAVDLEKKAGIYDGVVLVLHYVGQGV